MYKGENPVGNFRSVGRSGGVRERGVGGKLATSNNKLVIRDGFTKGRLAPVILSSPFHFVGFEIGGNPYGPIVSFCVSGTREASLQGTITSLC